MPPPRAKVECAVFLDPPPTDGGHPMNLLRALPMPMPSPAQPLGPCGGGGGGGGGAEGQQGYQMHQIISASRAKLKSLPELSATRAQPAR
ncbi:hypothetical protein Purlil1_2862 [Purpureocillium lilacinum]|uniref:Uncharacterized protein n=1 Tax=Purpureocillium lilacinum TaxID=33203 RepID=A0ABR0C9Q4_PURLI|nr:hypothetical protein Purlil1_2862 [Purpureocillium lilacinum]